MDLGQIVYITSRLVLGALASFFAIMLWSKTRDVAWMLMVIGTIAAYIEIVYSILGILGITEGDSLLIGSIPAASIVLPCLPMIFFIIAFVVMVFRKYRYKR
jgi:integral membrane sensor domain MASE1